MKLVGALLDDCTQPSLSAILEAEALAPSHHEKAVTA
jgi:hypothetical protein